MYCSSALSQTAAPPTAPPAQVVAGASDETLTKAIYSALNADPHHYFRHVEVRVDKGVAKLSGHVDSSAAIYRARAIAGKVAGVTRVDTNHLKIDTQLRR